MGKPDFCLFKNKDADHLCSNRRADQHLYFCHLDSTIALFMKSKISMFKIFFCDCTCQFVSDLGGNLKDQFSREVAHVINNVCNKPCVYQ